jgi:hypothetical protein
MIRLLSILASTMLSGLMAWTPRPMARTAQETCSSDTLVQQFTLRRVTVVLDPASTNAAVLAFRARVGLGGIRPNGVRILTDAPTCARALRAYATISFPMDTTKQRNMLASVPDILVVQLSPNRLVLNALITDPIYVYEHLLVDSTFSLISRSF